MALDRSTIWPYRDGEPGEFFYSRYDHPAGVEAERALGKLEGGHALLFSSGAAASTTAALGLVGPGQTIALAEGAYYGTSMLFRRAGALGAALRRVRPDRGGARRCRPHLARGAVESVPHLPRHGSGGRAPRSLCSWTRRLPPVLFRPLEHGADVVLHSATKYLGGHHDALAGMLAFRGAGGLRADPRVSGDGTGPVAAPDTAWLVLRGLKTLEVRVRRQSDSALELARRLAEHPRVERVRYPGLGDDRAARYMSGGFGGLMSFDVPATRARWRRRRG